MVCFPSLTREVLMATAAAARTATGSSPFRTRWRTVELMTAAVIGVTFGVAYWAYDAA
ncbi:MAG: hypothetical protein QOK30_1260, partial [Nocardioidaceae bacterium]|nr:hypothetical protein [Nocardioidaceae bacterium]